MIALMPVICCRTASPRPILSGVRQRGANTSVHDVSSCSETQRRLDRREPRVEVVLRAESDEVVAGVVGTADLDQPARQLKSAQDGEREENTGDRGDGKHGAPAVRAGKRLVDEISDKDADRDRELIGRDESPALRGRRELRRIERGRDRGDANAEAGHQPAATRGPARSAPTLDHRADDEEPGRGEERALAAEMVGDIAAGERSEHRSQSNPTGHDFERDRADSNAFWMPRRAPEMTP